MAFAYLSAGNNQDKVAGFINMDSGHNLLDGLPESVVFVKDSDHGYPGNA